MRSTTPNSPQFVPASAIIVLIDTLADIGGDVRGVLQRSGLGMIEKAAREGRATLIPRVAFAQLASDCVLALHAESCRKNGLQLFPVRNHRILLLAMLSCATLRDAVGIMSDFNAMLGERFAQWTVRAEGRIVQIILDRKTREKSLAEFLISLFSLASYHRILGWLIKQELPLATVTLSYPNMMEETGLQGMFTIDPRFQSHLDSFAFSDHYLNLPIARNPSEIDELFASFPFDFLPPDYGNETLSRRVEGAIRASLSLDGAIPTLETMAQTFGMTAITLQRRLAAEGTSFIEARTRCRKELAMSLLVGTNLSIREIASRLIYADTPTFRRAFYSWTSKTPTAWRKASQIDAATPN